MARNIGQLRRALSGAAFNISDLEEYLDLVALDSAIEEIETLVEQAQEAQAEDEDKDEDEDSDDDED